MTFEKLKLNKQLLTALENAGCSSPKEIQAKMISRINGGKDLVGVGPDGCGKTTTLVISVINKLKYAQDPPRALILVPNKEKVLALVEQFQLLGKNTDLRILGVYPGVGLEGQKEALAEGTDIVIGTPDRIHAIYLKSGLNLNKLHIFVVDDAEMIIKQGFQTLVFQISERLPKCQHIIFSEVYHDKLEKLGSHFLNFPDIIEVSEQSEVKIETVEQVLYRVPNFKTKLNLINELLRDKEDFTKAVVFVNTLFTAETLYKNLSAYHDGEIALLKSSFDGIHFESIEDFKEVEEVRLLLVVNEESSSVEISEVPILLHFDVPEDKELFINRTILKENRGLDETLAITFATDIELSLISKIEQAIGQKIPVDELPEGLYIEADRGNKHEEDEDSKKPQSLEQQSGGAFHEKKKSNAKDYNLKYFDRLKMFGKKNRKHKRGL